LPASGILNGNKTLRSPGYGLLIQPEEVPMRNYLSLAGLVVLLVASAHFQAL
jgi:hypothetical protein